MGVRGWLDGLLGGPEYQLKAAQQKIALANLLGQNNSQASLLGGTYVDPQTGRMSQRGPEMGGTQALFDNAPLPQPGQGGQAPRLVEPLLGSQVPQNQQRYNQLVGMAFPDETKNAMFSQQAIAAKRARIAGLPVDDATKNAMYAEMESPEVAKGLTKNLEVPDATKINNGLIAKIGELGGPDVPAAKPYVQLFNHQLGMEQDPNKVAELKAHAAEMLADADKARADAGKTRNEYGDVSQAFKRQFGTEVPPGFTPEIVNGKLTGKIGPIQGGEKDPATAQANNDRAKKEALPNVTKAYESAMSSFDDTLDTVDRMLAPSDRTKPAGGNNYALNSGLEGITGFGGTAVGDFITPAGGESAKVRAMHNRLEASAFLTSLNDLKSSSPTGASGLGALSETEGKKVQAAKSEMDRRLGKADYIEAVQRYRDQVARSKAIIQKAYQDDYGKFIQPAASQQGASAGGSSGGWSIRVK